MKVIKYLSIFVSLLFVVACGLPEMDRQKAMSELDIEQVNKNEAEEQAEAGNSFFVSWIEKNGGYLPDATLVTNDGTIPIVIEFDNGKIGKASDIDVKIYKVETDGSRGSAVNITSNNIVNLNTYSLLYIYTETLSADTTYEFVITARNTKNDVGLTLDNDNDGKGGESEDDIVIRFSTGSSVNYSLMPNPSATLSIPVLGPGDIQAGRATTNSLADITNGPAIDTSSLSDSIKLISLTENKSYDISISYDTDNRRIIITYPSSLPLGAYQLTVDERKIKESSAINGYIHRGSYNDSSSYSPTYYKFRIISTNTLPTISVLKDDIQVAWISCNVDLDTSTINSSTVIVKDAISGKIFPFDIIKVDNRNVWIKVKGTSGDFTWPLDIYLDLSKIKSANGDVAGTGWQSYL